MLWGFLEALAVVHGEASEVAEAPAQGDRRDAAGAAAGEDFLAHRGEPVVLQVAHRRHPEVATEALEQLEPRDPGGAFHVLQAQGLAGVGLEKLAGAQQVVRRAPAKALLQGLAVVVRLGQDQSLDQRAFQVAAEKRLGVEFAARHLLADVPHGAPPRRGGAVQGIHLRIEAQGRIDRPLQHLLQDLAHRRAADHHLQLAAVPGDAQLLALVGRDDHPAADVGEQAQPARHSSCSPLSGRLRL